MGNFSCYILCGKSLSSRRQNGHWVIVTTALVSVIIIASLIGTFVPLLLDKFGIDPALTGPFITTVMISVGFLSISL
jgi:Mg/Co/Ni transporter MgtE